jgi:hypothetical protein
MIISKVYKWTDANAPVLSGTAGSLINVLTKCLVDGYGEMAGAGWERTFANVALTIAAFRNIAGNGMFLRIDEATAAVNTAYVQGYEIMTDETTGTGPFYPLATTTLLTKSTEASTAARAWVVVANDKAMWVYFTRYGTDFSYRSAVNTATATLFWFGDFPRFSSAEEGFNTGIGFGEASSPSTLKGFLLPSSIPTTGGGYIRTPRDISGAPLTGNSVTIIGGGIFSHVSSLMRTNSGPTFDGSRLLLAGPFYIADSSSSTAVRGFFPGLFAPCHTFASFTPLQVVVIDGRSFLNIAFREYYQLSNLVDINLFIELGVDWHA